MNEAVKPPPVPGRYYETEMAQDAVEHAQFIELMRGENIRSYLEIGARYGGSVWRVATELLTGLDIQRPRVVAVDLAAGFGGRVDGPENLDACMAELRARGYDAAAIYGNSMDPEVVTRVRKMGKFDLVFIDGDHKLPAVKADWINYGSLGRIVAFHDISWFRKPKFKGTRIEVPLFWSELKKNYRHKEFRQSDKDNGIGVLWRE